MATIQLRFLRSRTIYQRPPVGTPQWWTTPSTNLLAQRQKNTSYEYAEHLSWHPGGHNVRFGAKTRAAIREHTCWGMTMAPFPRCVLALAEPIHLLEGRLCFLREISLRERERASELLALLTGVLDSATQTFNINSPTASAFVAGEGAERRLRQTNSR